VHYLKEDDDDEYVFPTLINMHGFSYSWICFKFPTTNATFFFQFQDNVGGDTSSAAANSKNNTTAEAYSKATASKMVSRRKILSRSRDDLNLGAADQEDEEDVWYQRDKLFKVSYKEGYIGTSNQPVSCPGDRKIGSYVNFFPSSCLPSLPSAP